jgi:hypothetical protein
MRSLSATSAELYQSTAALRALAQVCGAPHFLTGVTVFSKSFLSLALFAH